MLRFSRSEWKEISNCVSFSQYCGSTSHEIYYTLSYLVVYGIKGRRHIDLCSDFIRRIIAPTAGLWTVE